MTDHCSLCGAPLHSGHGSNWGSCSVCSVVTCIRCTTFTFCPTHFQALSPRGQISVKMVYRASWILSLCIMILTFYPGIPLLSETLTPQGAFPIVVFGLIIVPMIPVWKKDSWLKAIWLRDTGHLELPYTVWKCKTCGFKNPPTSPICKQCNRPKAA